MLQCVITSGSISEICGRMSWFLSPVKSQNMVGHLKYLAVCLTAFLSQPVFKEIMKHTTVFFIVLVILFYEKGGIHFLKRMLIYIYDKKRKNF